MISKLMKNPMLKMKMPLAEISRNIVPINVRFCDVGVCCMLKSFVYFKIQSSLPRIEKL